MIPLIDTHQHLMYPKQFGYSWTDKIPVLNKTQYDVGSYENLVGDHVVASIFMELALMKATIAQKPSSPSVSLLMRQTTLLVLSQPRFQNTQKNLISGLSRPVKIHWSSGIAVFCMLSTFQFRKIKPFAKMFEKSVPAVKRSTCVSWKAKLKRQQSLLQLATTRS